MLEEDFRFELGIGVEENRACEDVPVIFPCWFFPAKCLWRSGEFYVKFKSLKLDVFVPWYIKDDLYVHYG